MRDLVRWRPDRQRPRNPISRLGFFEQMNRRRTHRPLRREVYLAFETAASSQNNGHIDGGREKQYEHHHRFNLMLGAKRAGMPEKAA